MPVRAVEYDRLGDLTGSLLRDRDRDRRFSRANGERACTDENPRKIFKCSVAGEKFHRRISDHGSARRCHPTIVDSLRWNRAEGIGESIFDRLQK